MPVPRPVYTPSRRSPSARAAPSATASTAQGSSVRWASCSAEAASLEPDPSNEAPQPVRPSTSTALHAAFVFHCIPYLQSFALVGLIFLHESFLLFTFMNLLKRSISAFIPYIKHILTLFYIPSITTKLIIYGY